MLAAQAFLIAFRRLHDGFDAHPVLGLQPDDFAVGLHQLGVLRPAPLKQRIAAGLGVVELFLNLHDLRVIAQALDASHVQPLVEGRAQLPHTFGGAQQFHFHIRACFLEVFRSHGAEIAAGVGL